MVGTCWDYPLLTSIYPVFVAQMAWTCAIWLARLRSSACLTMPALGYGCKASCRPCYLLKPGRTTWVCKNLRKSQPPPPPPPTTKEDGSTTSRLLTSARSFSASTTRDPTKRIEKPGAPSTKKRGPRGGPRRPRRAEGFWVEMKLGTDFVTSRFRAWQTRVALGAGRTWHLGRFPTLLAKKNRKLGECLS